MVRKYADKYVGIVKHIIYIIILCVMMCLTFTANDNVTVNCVFAEQNENEPEEKYAVTPVMNFSVSGIFPEGNGDISVNWWYSKWEDCHYIFLPASARRDALRIEAETENGETVYLDDEALVSGDVTDILDSADEFTVKAGEEDCGKLKVMQSNQNFMYIDTSGGIDSFLKAMNIAMSGTALICTADGRTEYCGEIDKISGRGNSSWIYSEKKSYNIKLEKKADLFGMGKAKKWMLISNALDQSLIRNDLAISMSRESGMENVLDSVYIDLFADGQYLGLYQLYERVEINKNRIAISDLEERTEEANTGDLSGYERITEGAASPDEYMENSCKYYDIPIDPDDITGGYLLEFQLWNRYGSKAKSGFVTSKGQAVEIKSPEYVSAAQMEYIRTFVQDMEDAIYSEEGFNSKGKHYSEYIDIESLVRDYLVQEITMNVDGTFASFFLWKDSDRTGDGKIHFGPVWDFDLTFGTLRTYYGNAEGITSYAFKPDNLFVANFPVSGYKLHYFDTGSGRPTYGMSWVAALYRKPDFLKKVAKDYSENFDEYVRELCIPSEDGSTLIGAMADRIRVSAQMNNARWHTFGNHPLNFSSGDTYDECVEYVRNYLEKRQVFLSNLWNPVLENDIRGDMDSDGDVDAQDVMIMSRYLLVDNVHLVYTDNSDMNGDGCISVLDFRRLKAVVLEGSFTE